jgi:hypothetical protein
LARHPDRSTRVSIQVVTFVLAGSVLFVFAPATRAQEPDPPATPLPTAACSPGGRPAPVIPLVSCDDENREGCDQIVPTKPDPKKPDVRADRIFGVLPNYTTVERDATALDNPVPPVTTRDSFRMAALNSFDPYVFPFVGFVAGVAHLQGQEPSFGQGAAGYSKRYATALADNTIGNFLTTAVFPSALRQDPRYFALGEGGFLHRLAYAASRSVVTRSRDGMRQFNLSEIGGNGVAAAFSNFYYPSENRSVTGTLTRWGAQVMWDTLSNELKEFWPDVRRRLRRQ